MIWDYLQLRKYANIINEKEKKIIIICFSNIIPQPGLWKLVLFLLKVTFIYFTKQSVITAKCREKGFNNESVNLFFDLLDMIVRSNGIDGSRIFNINESGLSTVKVSDNNYWKRRKLVGK